MVKKMNVSKTAIDNAELLSQVNAWSNISLILLFAVLVLLFWIFLGRRIKDSLGFKIKQNKYEAMLQRCQRIEPMIDSCKIQIDALIKENKDLKYSIEEHKQNRKAFEKQQEVLIKDLKDAEKNRDKAFAKQQEMIDEIHSFKDVLSAFVNGFKEYKASMQESKREESGSDLDL